MLMAHVAVIYKGNVRAVLAVADGESGNRKSCGDENETQLAYWRDEVDVARGKRCNVATVSAHLKHHVDPNHASLRQRVREGRRFQLC